MIRRQGTSRVSRPHVGRAVVCCVLLGSVSGRGRAWAADAYFERAMERIEQTLVVPGGSYGFKGTDTYSGADGKVIDRGGYAFFTKNGKVHWRLDKVDPKNLNSNPYSSTLTVRSESGDQGKTQAADSMQSKYHNLTVNIENFTASIGLDDTYTFYSQDAQNTGHPNNQPYQLLVNPCFAPLRLTPAQLRNAQVTPLPSENGMRVYQVELRTGTAVRSLRLYFSPEHGDSLARSEYETLRDTGQGVVPSGLRESRAIEQWRRLPDGTYVPARLRTEHQHKGKTQNVLIREITEAVIGDVEDALFDPDKLPEFNQAWDSMYDRKRRFFFTIPGSQIGKAFSDIDYRNVLPIDKPKPASTSSSPASLPSTAREAHQTFAPEPPAKQPVDAVQMNASTRWRYSIAILGVFVVIVALGWAMTRAKRRKAFDGNKPKSNAAP